MMDSVSFSFKPAYSHNNPGFTFTNTDLSIRHSPVITLAVFRAPSLACLAMLVINKHCTKQPKRLDRLATVAQWKCEWEWKKFIRAQQHSI